MKQICMKIKEVIVYFSDSGQLNMSEFAFVFNQRPTYMANEMGKNSSISSLCAQSGLSTIANQLD